MCVCVLFASVQLKFRERPHFLNENYTIGKRLRSFGVCALVPHSHFGKWHAEARAKSVSHRSGACLLAVIIYYTLQFISTCTVSSNIFQSVIKVLTEILRHFRNMANMNYRPCDWKRPARRPAGRASRPETRHFEGIYFFH